MLHKLRHYEPEFNECDRKWLLLNSWHVQKASVAIAICCAVLAILMAGVGLVLFRSAWLLFPWLVMCLLFLAISALALVGAIRRQPALLLPFLFGMYALCLVWFTVFFCLLCMIPVPEFWQHWVHAALNIGANQPTVNVVRLITIAGMLFAFLLLGVLTVANFGMQRTRNFLIAKQLAEEKADGENGKRGGGGTVIGKNRKQNNKKQQVQMMETVT